MKILLIEDDVRLAERLVRHLTKKFIVEVVHSGQDGVQKALSVGYAVVLLDLHLPDTYGLAVCEQLRNAGVATPIVVISNDQAVQSRITLLDHGVDDFLVKPFSPDELTARIQAVLRRCTYKLSAHILTLGDLEIDTNRRFACRSGMPIALRRKEYDVLEYLVTNRGRAVTRPMILSHVWEDSKDTWQNTVDVHIKHLRDKIDRPYNTNLIKTVYGIGYMVDDSS